MGGSGEAVRVFLWAEEPGQRKWHYAPWDALEAPKEGSGVGLPDVDLKNIALL